MKNLFLIRGLPGCGKTTLTNALGVRFEGFYEADDFFYVDGEYQFDPSKLSQAHQQCQSRCLESLENDESCVVSNTFTQRWEMQPYIEMAEKTGARLTVIDLFDGGQTDEELAARNQHGVPLVAIKRMRDRYEHDWRSGKTTRS
jgi:predicted kinase